MSPSSIAVWWFLAAAGMSVALIVLDHLTGPHVRVSIWFVLPVGMVAYRWGWQAGAGLGVLFGISRLWLSLGLDTPWLVRPELVNLGLSLVAFAAVAVAAQHAARAREQTDQNVGELPVCGGCGRVQDPSGRWLRFENFVTTVAKARFRHTLCPECNALFARAGRTGSTLPARSS
jgi:hypothetical protein